MSIGPDSVILRFLRRMNARLDRAIDDLAEMKVRMANVEESLAALNRRVDRIELRIDRIERGHFAADTSSDAGQWRH